VKKHLALGAVFLAIVGLFLLNGVGAAREWLQPRAYLPLVENNYDEVPLPAPVVWKGTQLPGPQGYVTSIAAISNGDLLALSLTSEGIQLFRSQDEGASWGVVDDPVLSRETRAYRLYASPTGPSGQAVFAIGFFGLARSGDGGVSWQHVDGNLPVGQLVALAFSPDYESEATVYALSISTEGTGPYLYISRDRGQAWQTQSDVADMRNSGLMPNDLAAFGPGGLVIATSSGIVRTEDGGATWQQVAEPFAESGGTPAIRAITRMPSGELLVLSSGQRIPYKSNDGGLTWHWTAAGMDAACQYQGGLTIAGAPGRLFLAAAGIQGNAPGVFYSPDGDIWRPIPLGLPAGAGISTLGALSQDKLLVASADKGLWKVEALP